MAQQGSSVVRPWREQWLGPQPLVYRSARRPAQVERLRKRAAQAKSSRRLRPARPWIGLTGLAAGFHAVAPLPPGCAETAVVAAARERLVGLHGMGAYRGHPERAAPPALVLGFGNVRERAVEPAVAAIADLLR